MLIMRYQMAGEADGQVTAAEARKKLLNWVQNRISAYGVGVRTLL